MVRRSSIFLLSVASLAAAGCGADTDRSGAVARGGGDERPAIARVRAAVDSLAALHGTEIAVYYRSLADGGDSLLVRPDLRMHAASTMKVPVLLQLYLDRDAGRLALDDSVPVDVTFRSIVDGSPYRLDAGSDSDSALYERVGDRMTYRELAHRMITRSSNLATNLLIADLDAARVTATMRALGADSIDVLRGVEDLPAFEAGLNNTTTARDLGILFVALGATDGGEAGNPGAAVGLTDGARSEMLEVLEQQEFRDKIPAGLPAGVRAANKTGWITGISHDAAVVFPPAHPRYVLVVLTRGFEDDETAERVIAEISQRVWAAHTGTVRVVDGR